MDIGTVDHNEGPTSEIQVKYDAIQYICAIVRSHRSIMQCNQYVAVVFNAIQHHRIIQCNQHVEVVLNTIQHRGIIQCNRYVAVWVGFGS